MIEPVPGPGRFRSKIAAIIGLNRRFQRHPAYDLNSRLGQTVELGRVVGEQHDARAVEHLQHSRGDTVVALIVIKAERCIGIDRVEPALLHLIGAHLVGQAEPAALLRQIENDAAAYIVDAREREFKLIAAIAPPRAEDVAGEASGMQAHGDRLGEGRALRQ